MACRKELESLGSERRQDAGGGNLDDNDVVRGLRERDTELIHFFFLIKRPHASFKYVRMIDVMTLSKNAHFNNITLALPSYATIENMNALD